MGDEGTERVGDLLGELKERSGRSYEWLGRRISASKSTVHRYCTGQTLPDRCTTEQLASLCDATSAETAELLRRWRSESGSTSDPAPPGPENHRATAVPAEPPPSRWWPGWRLAAPALAVILAGLIVGLGVMWQQRRTHVDDPLSEYRSAVPGGRGYGSVNADRTRIQACDLQADKWGVRTHYETDTGPGLVGDANGAEDRCGEEGPDTGGFVQWFQTCAGIKGTDTECGPVVHIPPPRGRAVETDERG